MSDVAIITYVHNEPFHLDKWLQHYSQSFDGQDIYVIDNNGTDGSIQQAQRKYTFNTLELKTQFNHDFQEIRPFVRSTLDRLFTKYQGIFIAESDEFLHHPQGLVNIARFYRTLPVDAIRCIGYEPVHDYFNGEPAVEQEAPLLQQRRIWREAPWMRKPVYLNKSLDYFAYMQIFDAAHPIADYQLTLVHTKFIDYQLMWERNQKTLAEGNFGPETLQYNMGWQNRIDSQELFDGIWLDAIKNSVPIPDKFKHIV